MNSQLIDELRRLNLKPGETYTVEVDGHPLEIRYPDEASVYEGQVMLSPWFDSPQRPEGTSPSWPGKLSPPDPPTIPVDEEAGS